MNLIQNIIQALLCVFVLIISDYNPNVAILCIFAYTATVVWTNAEKHQQVTFTRVRGEPTGINYNFLGNMWRDDPKQVTFSVLFTVIYILCIIYLYSELDDSTNYRRDWATG